MKNESGISRLGNMSLLIGSQDTHAKCTVIGITTLVLHLPTFENSRNVEMRKGEVRVSEKWI
jgi:hypothetical protein